MMWKGQLKGKYKSSWHDSCCCNNNDSRSILVEINCIFKVKVLKN